MRPENAARFDEQFAPRIAEAIAACFAATVHTEVLPYGGHGQPTRVRIHAAPLDNPGHYPHPLNLYLTWDSDEIERLMGEQGQTRFANYLAALPRKLKFSIRRFGAGLFLNQVPGCCADAFVSGVGTATYAARGGCRIFSRSRSERRRGLTAPNWIMWL